LLSRLPRLRHNARSHPLFISGGRRSLARLIGLAGGLARAWVSGCRVLPRIGRLRHKNALSKQDDSGPETGSEVRDSLHPMIVDGEEFSQTTSLQKRRNSLDSSRKGVNLKTRLSYSFDDMPAVLAVVRVIFGNSDFTDLKGKGDITKRFDHHGARKQLVGGHFR
jgi:hypothetical protein